MPKDWVIEPPWQGAANLADTLRISPVVAQVLHNRGINDEAAARAFLNPQAVDLLPPESLPNCRQAAASIVAALRTGRKIALHGDYDVDGITGVSILWHCLKLAGAEPVWHIPHRLEEGYGIGSESVERLAAEGAAMIVTVDCGVTGIEAARRARELGVELIVTDHHRPKVDENNQPLLPDALVVHPALSGPTRYANPDLSGAGVAFKLAWAIAQEMNGSQRASPAMRDFLVDAMGLAALGAIADVVPLLGENRIIARCGLQGLTQSKLPGIQALIQATGLAGKSIAGHDVGFKLAPRLNAIGRMGHARIAVDLLTRAQADEARRIAKNLDEQNNARQAVERKILAQARERVTAEGQDQDAARAIVLASTDWHAGVIGIVAGRIAEQFSRPTVLIAVENGIGQGSARSVRNFPLHEALAACDRHLLTHGGHAMAAGLRIEAGRIDAFREAFQAEAARRLTAADLRQKLRIDDVVSLGRLREQLVADLRRLEPHGAGNPAPRLASEWLDLAADPRAVGTASAHLQIVLTDGDCQVRGIAFGQASLRNQLIEAKRCRVAFAPIINHWNDRRSVEMQIEDFQFEQ